MSEPEWVYRQRRQRAAVALAMVVGLIAIIAVFGPALAGGLSIDLGGRERVAIDKPDVDEILAREQRQIDAQKKRKSERRQARAEHRAKPSKPKKSKKPQKPGPGTPAHDATGAAPAPASTPAPAPAPAPTHAPQRPDPATAEAPPLPQPSTPSDGPVDPRFY
jgi:hypothetical protein